MDIDDFFGNPFSYVSLGYANNFLYAFDQNSRNVNIMWDDMPFTLFPVNVGLNEIGIAADSARNTYISEGGGGGDFVKYDNIGNYVGLI